MNLEKEKQRMKEILDKMTADEFDNMLERCGINEIKNEQIKDCVTCKNNPLYNNGYSPVHTCDECTSLDHCEDDYYMWEIKNEVMDIPLGRLCCFQPLASETIYFGHMAGKVVDDFENMTFMYVFCADDEYFFSRNAIIQPSDVYTSNDAKKYFNVK